MSLTPERVAEIEARSKAATPGPWVNLNGGRCISIPGWQQTCAMNTAQDATFTSHARTDIPDLLAHVSAVEAERDEALRVCQKATDAAIEAAKTIVSLEKENAALREVARAAKAVAPDTFTRAHPVLLGPSAEWRRWRRVEDDIHLAEALAALPPGTLEGGGS